MSPDSNHAHQVDHLAACIAASQARLLVIADRVAAGLAEPGDEARLRIQREIIASYRKRLEKIDVPATVGDDAEAWLRSLTSSEHTRQSETR